MNKFVLLSLVLISIVLVSGCISGVGIAFTPMDDSGVTVEGLNTVKQANNQFAIDYYSKLNEQEDSNIFFSPYSISSALSMTYEGAKGQTAEEMANVFYFPNDDELRRSAYARLYNQINKPNDDFKLSTANALWAQEDYHFEQDYFDVIDNYYGGKVTNMDFITKTEESRLTINNWVEEQTNDKIKDLIPVGILTSLTRLVLTNAIYFKGTWITQFDSKDTREQDFKVSSDKTVQADMMSLTEEDFSYAETDDLQILELPYEGEELSMLILLPKEDLDQIELTTDNLEQWSLDLREQEVNIYIPKFKFETKYMMVKDLIEMGMPSAFNPPSKPSGADFSGMTGIKDLYITAVIHQAFVEVNEEGTEAAAATAVVMGRESAGPTIPLFRADHPFIFVIQQKETGNILFIGRVIDPTLE